MRVVSVLRGRPRSVAVDEAVSQAVCRLLRDRVYAAMSIEQVASTAKVAKTAIYRRWASKAEMVFALVIHSEAIEEPADHGSVAEDLRVLSERVVALLSTGIQELAQLRGRRGVLEHPQPVGLADLPGMLIGRHRPVGVALHARRIHDAQLAGQILHHRPRHIQRVLQKPAHIAHSGRLQHQPEPVVITPPITDQLPVDLIEIEEPLHICPRGDTIKTSIPNDLRISQKFQGYLALSSAVAVTWSAGKNASSFSSAMVMSVAVANVVTVVMRRSCP